MSPEPPLNFNSRRDNPGPALAYDRAVVQHVYRGAPLDLHTLPSFCTDSQEGCLPFLPMPKESEGIRGGARANSQTTPER